MTAGEERWTVDELASRTGITVRNIRFYTEQGLIDPPHRQGRVAVYDRTHRMRLELVRKLHDQGYTLAAIARVLARLPMDAHPEEIALRGLLFLPWVAPHVDQALLPETAHAATPVGGSAADTLSALGLTVSDGPEQRSPAHLVAHAESVAEAGVPLDLLTRAGDLMDRHLEALVSDLFDAAAQDLALQDWDHFMGAMGAAFPHLRVLVMEALAGRFAARINEHTRRWVASSTTTDPAPSEEVAGSATT